MTTTKIYRAFPELDDYSDEQCRVFLAKCHAKVPRLAVGCLLPVLSYAMSLPVFGAIGFLMARLLEGFMTVKNEETIAFFLSLFVLAGPVVLALWVRDFILQRQLGRLVREKLELLRCRQCRYLLIGVNAKDGQFVTCPECGHVNDLRTMGISEADLLPDAEVIQPH